MVDGHVIALGIVYVVAQEMDRALIAPALSLAFPAVIALSQPDFNQPFPKTHAIGNHIRIQSKALPAIPSAPSA